MNVPSVQFLGFCAIVAALLAPSADPRWRRGVLLVANVAFFATFWHGVASAVPFVAFLAAGYAAMRVAEVNKNRLVFAALLALFVAAFCWLKGYVFFPESTLLAGLYVTVGLSYAFFRVVSLIVDAFQGVLPERVGIAAYANYALNFTTFVAGPIQFYSQFRRDEVERPAPIDASVAARALERIVVGFFKVTVLSPLLLFAHERSVAMAVESLSTFGRVADAALMLAIFPIYVYANFSGYTDAVIGAARFLRLELPENFNGPFLSRGYLEFWNRWHMSLSTWFKTYVYSPFLLGLMRRFPYRSLEPLLGVFAYFVTFFLVGIWHGQTLAFVIFGLLNGAGVSGNKLYQLAMLRWQGRARYQALCGAPAYAALSSGLTFLWLAAALVFFWAGWGQFVDLVRVVGPAAIAMSALAVLLGAAAVYAFTTRVASPALAALRSLAIAAYVRPAWYAALAVIVVSVAVVLNAPAPHIVYKAF